MYAVEDLELRPLSVAQLGVWVIQMLEPRNPIFNIAEYLEILGPVDPRLFETALRLVVAETDSLHLRFVEMDDGPRQFLLPKLNWVMPFIDVTSEDDPRIAAEAWMREDMDRVVDLSCDHVFSYALFRAAPDRFFWYSRYHHLCHDGFGQSLLAQRVAVVYSALVEGRPAEAEKPGSWFELLDEEENYRRSARYVRDQGFWREQLVDRPEPVTLSGKLPARSQHSFIRRTGHLPQSVTEALRALGAAHGSSLPQVVTTAAALYLHRLTGARGPHPGHGPGGPHWGEDAPHYRDGFERLASAACDRSLRRLHRPPVPGLAAYARRTAPPALSDRGLAPRSRSKPG